MAVLAATGTDAIVAHALIAKTVEVRRELDEESATLIANAVGKMLGG